MKKLILFLLLLPFLATSQNEWLIGKTIENSRTYKARWLSDLGTLRSDNISKAFYAMSKQNGIADNIQFAWLGEAATKTRVSGVYSFATKLYSTVGTNDGTQTTELNQPYISGNIAPTERYALRNPNGDDNHIVFPTQTLTGSWSISMSINWNGSNNSIVSILGNNSATLSNIMLKNTDNKFSFQNQAGTTVSGSVGLTNKLIGKNKIIHLAASGTSLAIYIDGVLAETLTVSTDITLSRLMKGSATASREYFGDIKSLCIRTGAITATQVINEYNFLRSIYPEVETVKIGNQDWETSNCDMVCTPQGNVIANVTANANVEKITNGGFDSDTFWNKGAGATIALGLCTFTNVAPGTGISQSGTAGLTVGKLHKISITINSITSGRIYISAGINSIFYTVAGTYTFYLVPTSGALSILANLENVNCEIDNVSAQEIGWAGSTELYDGIYAQTTGTVEQKTYAAVKAAAMWRYPNNDNALGSWSGKLYNKYAAKLLSMDIGYFNTANPSSLWGYKIPTRAQLTTLSAIGGNAVKVEKTNYWTTENGTNASGLSLVGTGYVDSSGSYQENKLTTGLMCYDSDFIRRIINADNAFSEVAITLEGYPIRLIKD